MTEALLAGLWLCAFVACIYKRPTKPSPVSACEEAVASALIKLREAERWAPPGSGFKCQGCKKILVKGELFRVIVERADS